MAAAAFAAHMPPSVERDSLYLRTAEHLALEDPEAALTMVREISAPALRAQAVASTAGLLLGRGDSTRARALYEQALALADPRTPATDRVLVRPLRSLGELSRLRAWARSQPTTERRAEAMVLVLETLPP